MGSVSVAKAAAASSLAVDCRSVWFFLGGEGWGSVVVKNRGGEGKYYSPLTHAHTQIHPHPPSNSPHSRTRLQRKLPRSGVIHRQKRRRHLRVTHRLAVQGHDPRHVFFSGSTKRRNGA